MLSFSLVVKNVQRKIRVNYIHLKYDKFVAGVVFFCEDCKHKSLII